MPRALVLSQHDLIDWRSASQRGQRSSAMPYGMEALEDLGYELTGIRVGRGRVVTKLRNVAEHRTGLVLERPLRGVTAAARTDVIIAHLEAEARVAAGLKRHRIPPWSNTSLVMLGCWLADDARRLPSQERANLHRRFSSVDLIVYWSENQTEILESMGFRPEQLFAVPFGVDADYFVPPPGGAARSIDILAVGQDRGRDYGTLFEAVAGTDLRVDLVCKPENIGELMVPENVTVHSPVDHPTYRSMLQRAKTVVVPTFELAYPTGQSVALEASACGACVVLSGTRPLIEYFTDGENGLVVAPRDAVQLRAALRSALADEDGRAVLGLRARQKVEDRYRLNLMWQRIHQAMLNRGLVDG
jgi:glycosyltransferase involved in cell wall biosynthesis